MARECVGTKTLSHTGCLKIIVADTDPGPFSPQVLKSGMDKKSRSGSGMNNTAIFPRAYEQFFGV
jgi:hypothetical protein